MAPSTGVRLRAVLVVGEPGPARGRLLAALDLLAQAEWRADVVTGQALDDEVRAAVRRTQGHVALVGTPPPVAPPRPVGLVPLPKAVTVPGRNHLQREVNRVLQPAMGSVADARRELSARLARATPAAVALAHAVVADLDARRLLFGADLAVAVDEDAGLAVRRLARRRPDVTVVPDLAALRLALQR